MLFTPKLTKFGTVKADGSGLVIKQELDRDMNFGRDVRFRVVMKHDMMECYLDDYLVTLKRIQCDG